MIDPIAPTVEPSPTADDVRSIMRSQNWKVGILALVLLALGGATIWITADGRDAARNSADAVSAELANNARSACITERRNEQLASIGAMVEALGLAQDAGFFSDDEALLEEYRQQFLAATERQKAAAENVAPEVLNAPAPVGCGPPITKPNEIPKAQENP